MKSWKAVETFWWVSALKGADRKLLTPPSMRAKAFIVSRSLTRIVSAGLTARSKNSTLISGSPNIL